MKVDGVAWIEVRKGDRVLLRCATAALLSHFMTRPEHEAEFLKEFGRELYAISIPFDVVTIIKSPDGTQFEHVFTVESDEGLDE